SFTCGCPADITCFYTTPETDSWKCRKISSPTPCQQFPEIGNQLLYTRKILPADWDCNCFFCGRHLFCGLCLFDWRQIYVSLQRSRNCQHSRIFLCHPESRRVDPFLSI